MKQWISFPLLKNSKGWGVVELSVSMAILSLLTLISASMMVKLSTSSKTILQEINEETEKSLMKRILLRDFQNASPSFYSLSVKDDSMLNFYQLYHGVTQSHFQRSFTIKKGKAFFVLKLSKKKDITSIMYDPIKAYHVAGPSGTMADFNRPTALTFVSLNQNAYLTNTNRGKSLWQEGTLLLLNSPNLLYEGGGEVVRAPMFLGFVKGNQLQPYPDQEGIFIRTHPLDNQTVVSSADVFLRKLPAMGGGLPFVRLNRVELIKYEIKDSSFQRSTWNSQARDFVRPYTLAPEIESIVLSRAKSNSELIKIKMNFKKKPISL